MVGGGGRVSDNKCVRGWKRLRTDTETRTGTHSKDQGERKSEAAAVGRVKCESRERNWAFFCDVAVRDWEPGGYVAPFSVIAERWGFFAMTSLPHLTHDNRFGLI
ncbi:unnamed protein product [Sphenostylis stenocarpa]|uniref:Uncharacterized protein n=1 Tax=Sphenostylis stenocarpa TaxID=92480 RepID=A0AA86V4W3_9FABA|nr:unnamed protein product [Sphenostylis stenocarpa]